MSNTKDIKDYLHLYLGCEAMLTFKNGNIEKVTITTLPVEKPERFKPILRPLSDMTEEDCDLLGWDYKYQGKIISHRAENLLPEEVIILLKLGFDLFGLIESGLAIDKTKYLKSNCDHEYIPTSFGLKCRKCLIKLK